MNQPLFELNLAELSQVPAACLCLHVRRASRILTQRYDLALRPTGLVLNQFTLLVAIYLAGPQPVTRLAQQLATDQTTMTRNLKVLEKQSLVAIAPGEDRRVRLVRLTESGKAALAQALPLWQQAQAETIQHFGAQNWQTLLSLLSAVESLD
ncbi:MAG: winged helix-turn-helix transcriptional regulator [Leptolyngbya sp. SIO4C1]|nr:winged helix-turn-helix transcriptional regulator [Leptolyngbya sp. SIO4C1]